MFLYSLNIVLRCLFTYRNTSHCSLKSNYHPVFERVHSMVHWYFCFVFLCFCCRHFCFCVLYFHVFVFMFSYCVRITFVAWYSSCPVKLLNTYIYSLASDYTLVYFLFYLFVILFNFVLTYVSYCNVFKCYLSVGIVMLSVFRIQVNRPAV